MAAKNGRVLLMKSARLSEAMVGDETEWQKRRGIMRNCNLMKMALYSAAEGREVDNFRMFASCRVALPVTM